MVLFGCAFEDFLTRTLGEEAAIIVDDYLKRRGWKESVTNKRYMQALRDSEMSLYEVSEVVPGQSFLARDLMRGGPPVRVAEHMATQTLKAWDRLATRIVKLNGKQVMTERHAGRSTTRCRRSCCRNARRETQDAPHVSRRWRTSSMRTPDAATQREAARRSGDGGSSAPLISAMWLEDALGRVLDGARHSW